MTKLRIPHYYEEYDGDHTNKVRERIELNVLPFFARNLVAPANPTNPQISRRAQASACADVELPSSRRRHVHIPP